ncbi:hypothetical protein MBM_04196 [Drepanopeziza brunnea f. sp. 'multigermtubi' MB_m1]|uniref:Uncharacterized protein n=1 Tax=Marssonina brunnea f. sp. multigermtubi (strain MB_m1) TaxID=1072389 RepID=K1WYX5_MARBU|nr:uncharacterized protein MBM_04196 [Drepanopeziza brunnea f. sp. 'multigermtubi' MB_m1]EKD17827.1 hypothetical protein MBM_04196 [Drepanopeziza brunnea f. sp. 'multigermtubi' MB_m1]
MAGAPMAVAPMAVAPMAVAPMAMISTGTTKTMLIGGLWSALMAVIGIDGSVIRTGITPAVAEQPRRAVTSTDIDSRDRHRYNSCRCRANVDSTDRKVGSAPSAVINTGGCDAGIGSHPVVRSELIAAAAIVIRIETLKTR